MVESIISELRSQKAFGNLEFIIPGQSSGENTYKFTLTEESFCLGSIHEEATLTIYNANKETVFDSTNHTLPDLPVFAPGTYYVCVNGACDDMSVIIYSYEKVDRFEPNDSKENAAKLNSWYNWIEVDNNKIECSYAAPRVTLTAKNDVDWYKFSLLEKADIISVSGFGVTAELYGENGGFIKKYDLNTGEIPGGSAMSLNAGTYYVKVTGDYAGTYDLFINGYYTTTAKVEDSVEIYDVSSVTVAGKKFADKNISTADSWQFFAPRETFTYNNNGNDVEVETATQADSCLIKSETPETSLQTQMNWFVASANGTWEFGYVARHVGSSDADNGTMEKVDIEGMNKFTDFFYGAYDGYTRMVLTDDKNGDALFVDDMYSATPQMAFQEQSRINRISEIFAGAGNDVIDMTSNRIFLNESAAVIHGGSGDDYLWGDTGDVFFGDEGEDKIIGGFSSDLIVGGLGDDILNGGGGVDLFAFGNDDGSDTVTQMAGGKVILWFEDENVNQNGNEFTFGNNCKVIVDSTVKSEDITVVKGAGALKNEADDLIRSSIDIAEYKDSVFVGSTSDTVYIA